MVYCGLGLVQTSFVHHVLYGVICTEAKPQCISNSENVYVAAQHQEKQTSQKSPGYKYLVKLNIGLSINWLKVPV